MYTKNPHKTYHFGWLCMTNTIFYYANILILAKPKGKIRLDFVEANGYLRSNHFLFIIGGVVKRF